MPKIETFATPAYQDDLEGQPGLGAALRARWSDNIDRFTNQTLQNDPWSSTNQLALTDYFDLLGQDIPGPAAPVRWTAFPNRIKLQYPNVGQRKQWQYADEGPPAGYRPSGARGWQDEYCEWSVTRNSDGKITRVAFTCENREYWYTLWNVAPSAVLGLYKQLVGPQVKLEDLYARDSRTGQPIVDLETGRPAYNDCNQWNSTTTLGAVHLISNPNSLSAEIFLAGQATVLREDASGQPITERNQLINCSKFGTPGRNSDPTIGAFVNSVVRDGSLVTLSNPVGLYIQTPAFGQFQLPFTAPPGKQPSDYWKVVRGRVAKAGEPLDYILHAVFEVPEEDGFTVGDIAIDGFNIDFGSQIAETFKVALAGATLERQGAAPPEYRCAGSPTNPLPRPYLMAYSDMLSIATRSSLNVRIEQGASTDQLALIVLDGQRNSKLTLPDAQGVSLEVLSVDAAGNDVYTFTLSVTVAANAAVGPRSIQATNADGSHGPPVYGLFEIVPQGSLSKGAPTASSPGSETQSLAMHRDAIRQLVRSR